MPETSGSLSTFGSHLHSKGFFGASRINPDDMQNNCVSVAVAHLLYYRNVHEHWAATYGKHLAGKPLDLTAIEDLLHRTGHQYRWIHFEVTPDCDVREYIRKKRPFGRASPISVACFMRPDGSGHAVNLMMESVYRGSPGCYDYQHSDTGQPAWSDLSTAVWVTVFYETD